MSNTQHTTAPLNGTASTRPERRRAAAAEAGQSLPELIGQAVGLHVANVMQQALAQMQPLPNCLFCVLGAKQLIHFHEIACANAVAAGEPQPDLPEPPQVARAITWVNVAELVPGPAGPVPVCSTVPACWEHVRVPQAPPKQTGLAAPDGRPLITQG